MSVDEMPATGNRRVRLHSPHADVALWWCDLDWDAGALAAGEALLAPAERVRAGRFSQPGLRARYVAGRASLRHVLGAVLDMPAAQVPIVRGERGRPHVAVGNAPDFNVSNTRMCALIGIATSGRIGVDIEHRDRATAATRLARKFLGDEERAALASYPDAIQRERFLRFWTCKEAMSKATGDGIAAPFARMQVSIEPTLRLVAGAAPYIPAAWQLWAADVPADYLGTVAQWASPTAPR